MKPDTLNKIINSYQYDANDAEVVLEASKIILPHVNDFSSKLHEHVFSFEHAKAFLKTGADVEYHKEKIEYWISQVFIGVYTNEFYDYLNHINYLHKRIGLPSNYINSTFTFIRRYIRNKLVDAGALMCLDSVEKILDLNLELLSTQYVSEDFEETLAMIRLLRESIDNDYIEPYVQMIADADTLKPASYECLCRIVHPTEGVILPWRFLDIAKQIDMYSEITKTMFEKSFEYFKNMDVKFSLNLSFLDISNEETHAFLNNLIDKYSFGDQLILEIVETEQLSDMSLLFDFIAEVKEKNTQVAIDDFGAGFSNFNNIDKLSPDYLKIDGSLIKDIDKNSINHAAVESIVAMSKKLGIKTVAEYIHSEAVLNICKGMGICKLQGFYIEEPKSIKLLKA